MVQGLSLVVYHSEVDVFLSCKMIPFVIKEIVSRGMINWVGCVCVQMEMDSNMTEWDAFALNEYYLLVKNRIQDVDIDVSNVIDDEVSALYWISSGLGFHSFSPNDIKSFLKWYNFVGIVRNNLVFIEMLFRLWIL